MLTPQVHCSCSTRNIDAQGCRHALAHCMQVHACCLGTQGLGDVHICSWAPQTSTATLPRPCASLQAWLCIAVHRRHTALHCILRSCMHRVGAYPPQCTCGWITHAGKLRKAGTLLQLSCRCFNLSRGFAEQSSLAHPNKMACQGCNYW